MESGAQTSDRYCSVQNLFRCIRQLIYDDFCRRVIQIKTKEMVAIIPCCIPAVTLPVAYRVYSFLNTNSRYHHYPMHRLFSRRCLYDLDTSNRNSAEGSSHGRNILALIFISRSIDLLRSRGGTIDIDCFPSWSKKSPGFFSAFISVRGGSGAGSPFNDCVIILCRIIGLFRSNNDTLKGSG